MGALSVLAPSAISISVLFLVYLFARSKRNLILKTHFGDPDQVPISEETDDFQPQKQAGVSIMEQLVPEITQHMLSYLDYRSLCNVSMTNSCMSRVANDDSIWKALFHKSLMLKLKKVSSCFRAHALLADTNGEMSTWSLASSASFHVTLMDFTVEQSCVMTPYGWKAHYAVTKAVIEADRNFYKYFQMKSIKGMSRLWLNSDYIKCIHPNGDLTCGYDAIMEQWRTIFSLNQRFEFELQDERVRVFGNMAWITVKEFINSSTEPLLTTNVFEYHCGHWFMVHHHSSLLLEGGNIFGPLAN